MCLQFSLISEIGEKQQAQKSLSILYILCIRYTCSRSIAIAHHKSVPQDTLADSQDNPHPAQANLDLHRHFVFSFSAVVRDCAKTVSSDSCKVTHAVMITVCYETLGSRSPWLPALQGMDPLLENAQAW